MSTLRTNLGLVAALALVIGLAFAVPTFAQMHGHAGMMNGNEGMNHQNGTMNGQQGMAQHNGMMNNQDMMMSSPHGGAMHEADGLRFETVFTESDVRVYVYNADGKELPMKDMTGTVTYKNADGKSTILPLAWTDGKDDAVAANRVRPGVTVDPTLGYLAAKGDFEAATNGSFDAQVAVKNLPGDNVTTAQWSTPYERAALFGYACPMHPAMASLQEGTCSECGGMALQPTQVFYECCGACGNMEMTTPGTCPKCGMELKLKAANYNGMMGEAAGDAHMSEHMHQTD